MKIVVLTGAGISAESGIKTFRDAGGLWEGHKIEEVATPEAWRKNPTLVNQFYNERRRQLLNTKPNEAHKILVALEQFHTVSIITQNVDDLHERAGSSEVLHLHGELRSVRSSLNPNLRYRWDKDLNHDDLCELGSPLRPDIVWFGEDVPKIADAIDIVETAEMLVIIGTSLAVYPAAGLIHYAPRSIPIIYIDKNPNIDQAKPNRSNLKVYSANASEALSQMIEDYQLMSAHPNKI
ncbi:MAG TPA: Sir2 family NAD-dependent protein deacetylase [Saprospiraceae bacterium]|nr:Sir2 family NAD-dependent protein deacetylase [Saprospiraceae bacterium]